MTERAVMAEAMDRPVQEPEKIRVRKDTDSGKLARVLELALVQHGRAVMQGIGAQAVSVMVKAAVRARGRLAMRGRDLRMVPAFYDSETAGDKRKSGIQIRLELAPEARNGVRGTPDEALPAGSCVADDGITAGKG